MKTASSPSSKLVSSANKLRQRLSKVSDEQREDYLQHALAMGKKKETRVTR
jgi:hypothetical protein